MALSSIELKVKNLLENIILNNGYLLYDVIYEKEGKDFYLRIVIDKESGNIDISDCEKVNNAITDILDKEDLIKDQYFLEVSSPGVERLLRNEEHFKSQIGNEIKLKLFKQIEGKKELIGILEEYNKGEITIRVDNATIKINSKDVAVARTIFNW